MTEKIESDANVIWVFGIKKWSQSPIKIQRENNLLWGVCKAVYPTSTEKMFSERQWAMTDCTYKDMGMMEDGRWDKQMEKKR